MKFFSICLIFMVFAFGFLAFPPSSYACSCNLDISKASISRKVKNEKTRSEAVFIGEVIAIAKNTLGRQSVKMKIISAWKGVKSTEVMVFTGAGGGDGGFPFELNQKYLVYAQISTVGSLTTSICTRTAASPTLKTTLGILAKLQDLTSPRGRKGSPGRKSVEALRKRAFMAARYRRPALPSPLQLVP